MTTRSIELGYGGGAEIDGFPVLLTGGSLTKTLNIPFISPYDVPADNSGRARVKMGDGTYVFSGNFSFDLTLRALDGLINSNFLKRNKEFEIRLDDGYKSYEMDKCKFDNISFSASANALVTGNISFQSITDFTDNESTYDAEYIFDDDENRLVNYWNTGNTGVESFTMSISQPLTPVYLNVPEQGPQYLRAGMWSITMDINTWDEFKEHFTMRIGSKQIQLFGTSTNWGFNYGGSNATGSHNVIITAHNVDASDKTFFQII